MKYACLIYTPEDVHFAQRNPDEEQAMYAEYGTLMEQASAILRGGEELAESATATTVRVRDGKRVTTDGPFAESKEVLGGFFLIDVPSIDQALDFAAKIPGARHGSIEVRPVVER